MIITIVNQFRPLYRLYIYKMRSEYSRFYIATDFSPCTVLAAALSVFQTNISYIDRVGQPRI